MTECIANCVLIDDNPKIIDEASFILNLMIKSLKEGKRAFDAHQIKSIGTIYSQIS